jgi:hypothetical protein
MTAAPPPAPSPVPKTETPKEMPKPAEMPDLPKSAPPPEKTADVHPPFKPSGNEPTVTTATFTFRTMDHLKACVIVNGERYSETSCLWCLSLQTDLDPKIPVGEWPPKGAAWVGAATGKDENGMTRSTIEIAIEGGRYDLAGQERLKKSYPHLEAGEQVLYVNAEICGKRRRGAVRLKLVGTDGMVYRYTDFSPIQSMEDENASLFARSVWFQREKEQ